MNRLLSVTSTIRFAERLSSAPTNPDVPVSWVDYQMNVIWQHHISGQLARPLIHQGGTNVKECLAGSVLLEDRNSVKQVSGDKV